MMSSIGNLRRSIFRFQHYNSKAEFGKAAESASTASQRHSSSTISSGGSSAARLHILPEAFMGRVKLRPFNPRNLCRTVR